ncbi:MAG: cell wall-binding repeat-containing protein [Nanohaloarchaea archaeon]|nr:cell wall-binding repeat-containing protein [Candidatus Nanohaloarchaea archaeon]
MRFSKEELGLLVAAILVLSGTVMAQDDNTTVEPDNQAQQQQVDTVIMTTTETYHDSLLAGQVAEKYGAPVLLTESEEIPETTSGTLEQLQPSNIVIVGGPAVVAPELEMQLSQNYNVERVSGETAEETASKVAQRFWAEGSQEVNLVDDDPTLLAGAVHFNDAPTLLVTQNASNTTNEALEMLQPQTANIFTTGEVGNITGVETQEYTGSVDQILEDARPETAGADTLVVTSRENFSYSIPAPYVPNAAVVSVDPENATQTLEDVEVEEIWAIGPEDFGQTISEATGMEAESFTGEPSEIASELVLRKQEEWSQLPGEELEIQETTTDNQTATPEEEMNQTENTTETTTENPDENMTETPEENMSENQTETPGDMNQTINNTENTTPT